MKASLVFAVPLCLTASVACLSTSETQSSGDKHLYDECNTTADCGSSGLLCDDRRGCVECVDDDDCPSGRRCSVGQCETRDGTAAAGDGSPSNAPAQDRRPDAGTPQTPEGDVPTGPDSPSGTQPSKPAGPSSDSGGPDTVNPLPTSTNSNDASTPASTTTDCEVEGQRVLRLAAAFRDFSNSHVDFGNHAGCSEVVTGLVEERLGDDGRPVLRAAPLDACISGPDSFATWYVDGPQNVHLDGQIVLFDDGHGGYVNRFGPHGEQVQNTEYGTERGGGDSDSSCSTICAYLAPDETTCAAMCTTLDAEATRAQTAYELALESGDYDDAELTALQAEAASASAEAESCDAACAPEIAVAESACSATCKPCSYDSGVWCAYGTLVSYDGTPLFFPVDSIAGPTEDRGEAKLPEEYGYIGWPWESEIFGEAVEHNFSFTTEIRFETVFSMDRSATLELLGDDDLWVFINGRLAIDLGGLHVPSSGAITLDAQNAAQFDLRDGERFEIAIFHAERMAEGSSFRLRLEGIEPTKNAQCDGR